VRPVVTVAEVRLLQHAVGDVFVHPLLARWIVDVVRATRALPTVAIGASVRGSLALERAVRAWALLDERDYATPDDVDLLFLPVLAHRIVFTPALLAEARHAGWDAALEGFRRECRRLAPPPELTWDDDEPPAG
jgi:MoxR-like ATPase